MYIINLITTFIKLQLSFNWMLEVPGIEPGAFHMQSERSTTELHPRCSSPSQVPFFAIKIIINIGKNWVVCDKLNYNLNNPKT